MSTTKAITHSSSPRPRAGRPSRRPLALGLIATGLAVLLGGCGLLGTITQPGGSEQPGSAGQPGATGQDLSQLIGKPWSNVPGRYAGDITYWPSRIDFANSDEPPADAWVSAVEINGDQAYSIRGVTVGTWETAAIGGLVGAGWNIAEQVTHAMGWKTTLLTQVGEDVVIQLTTGVSGKLTDVAIQQAAGAGPIRNVRTPAGTPQDCETMPLPAGVDRGLICGPVVSTVVFPPLRDAPSPEYAEYGFKSPTGNLFCGWDPMPDEVGDNVDCQALALDVPLPADPATDGVEMGKCDGLSVGAKGSGRFCATDARPVLTAQLTPTTPVLQYGETAVSTDNSYSTGTSGDPIACHSAENAITCWNTLSHHGFMLSRTVAVFW